jgi:hypothetical protein
MLPVATHNRRTSPIAVWDVQNRERRTRLGSSVCLSRPTKNEALASRQHRGAGPCPRRAGSNPEPSQSGSSAHS